MTSPKLVFAVVVPLAVSAGSQFAHGWQSRPDPMTMVVKLDLFLRTCPEFRGTGGRYGAPPLLYPEHANLQGLVYFGGPAESVDPIEARIQKDQHSPEALARLLGLEVERQEGERWVGVPEASRTLVLTPASGYEHYFWRFEVRVTDRGVWSDGTYQVAMTVTYERAGKQETCSSGPWPFVIRTFKPNSAEEVNFLTSLSLGYPENVMARYLLSHPELGEEGMYQRILKLDPYDVYARVRLAELASKRVRPAQVVEQFVKIKDSFDAGKATRLEALLLRPKTPRSDGPLPPPDRAQYARLIEERLEGSRWFERNYNEVVRRAQEALSKPDQAAVVRLLESEDMWLPLATIRVAASRRMREAYEPLVKKLAGADWLAQEEITQALSEITGNQKTLRPLAPATQRKAVIDWWLAHPTLDGTPADQSAK